MLRYCKGRGSSEQEVISPRSVSSYRRGAQRDATVADSHGDGLDESVTISSSRKGKSGGARPGSNRSTEAHQLELQPDSQIRNPHSLEEDLDDDDESEEDDEYYSDDEEVDGRGKVGRGAARDSDDAESPESIEENRV